MTSSLQIRKDVNIDKVNMALRCLKIAGVCIARAYLGEIVSMGSAEIAPLSKHMTPKFCITITSAKKILILQLM